MIVIVQIPVVDVRSFATGPTSRDQLPLWPLPDRVYGRRTVDHHRTNYVRGLGPVRPRFRGGVPAWLSETNFVDVSRRVRMERCSYPALTDQLDEPRRLGIYPLYRNFYTDGVVGRLEVCLRVEDLVDGLPLTLRRGAVADHVAMTGAWLRGGADERTPLAQFGRKFAEHFLKSTTTSSDTHTQSWWVQARTPALIMIQHSATASALSKPEYTVNHAWRPVNNVRMSVWDVSHTGDDEEIRQLRIHLSKLHADCEAVQVIAGLCDNEQLDPQHPKLHKYLKVIVRSLRQPAKHGYKQADLLAQVLGPVKDVYKGAFAVLGKLDDDTIRAPAKSLERLVTNAPNSDEISFVNLVFMKNEGPQFINDQFHGSAISIGNQSNATAYNTPSSDLEQLLQDLHVQARALAPQLPSGQAAAVQDAAEGVAREVGQGVNEKNKPRLAARLKSLMDTATSVGTAGGALAAAITAVRGALGI